MPICVSATSSSAFVRVTECPRITLIGFDADRFDTDRFDGKGNLLATEHARVRCVKG